MAFPDADSMSPLRVRVEIEARLERSANDLSVEAHAEAEAVPGSAATATPTDDGPAGPAYASGGGYSGPLAYRQGEGMRPDVAVAFDRMVPPRRQAGVMLVINSAYRSDAEQAVLFAEHPDPQWVAPPGQSLHRCATELDLGPPTAQAWLAANARHFGFLQRYCWEAWHFGIHAGPPPCSMPGTPARRAGSAEPRGTADGPAAEAGLPAFVPARFRLDGRLGCDGGTSRRRCSPRS